MALYILVTGVIIYLATFVKNNNTLNQLNTRQNAINKMILVFITIILFLLSALRVNVGNDYTSYIEIFEKIYNNKTVSTEIGFNFIVRLFQFFLGENTFIPIFAFFAIIIAYYMVRGVYEQVDIFWYGIAIFMFSGLYFNSFTTMRYYVALSIVIYSTKYMYRKDYLPFIIHVLIAATMHKTALLVIPVYLFIFRKWKKFEYILVGIGALTLIFFEDFYRRLVFLVYPFYENSVYDNYETSYFNIAKGICILCFALIYYKQFKKDEKLLFYFKLNLIAIIVYSCASFVPVVSRIAYYFVWAQIFLVANIVCRIENKKMKYLFGTLIFLVYIAFFIIYLKDATNPNLKLLPYKTWIMKEVIR